MAKYVLLSGGVVQNIAVWDEASEWNPVLQKAAMGNMTAVKHGQSFNKRSGAHTYNIVIDGNSIAKGVNGYSCAYNAVIEAGLTTNDVINMARDGHSTTDLSLTVTNRIDALYEAHNPGKNIIILWEGSNDIYQGKTAAQAFTNIKNYCLARKAVGWKVIVGTLTPRTTLAAVNQETKRLDVNTSIRNDSSFYDAIADVGADNLVGDITTCANTAYYYDGTHLAKDGHDLLVSYFTGAINAVK